MTRVRKTWLVDVVGGLTVASIVGVTGWYAFVKPDTASSQLHALTASVSQLNADLGRLQTMLGGQKARYGELSRLAESLGKLPSKSPIDQNLRQITVLAETNGLSVLEVAPVAQVQYPNVLELQYNIKMEGRYTDHLGFLKAFEGCSFWVDVTYLRFSEASAQVRALGEARQCDLTVSLYSAIQ